MTDQYPAWSVGRSNLQALTGKTCGLATDVLVEQDPNAGMLSPVDAPLNDALADGFAEGFDPNGIPVRRVRRPGDGTSRRPQLRRRRRHRHQQRARHRRAAPPPRPGINGSRARLPYGLDPAPHCRCWAAGAPASSIPARLRSAWYRLPEQSSERGRTTAGRLRGGPVRLRRGPDSVGHRRAGRRQQARRRHRLRRRRRGAGMAQPAGTDVRDAAETPPRCGWSPTTTTSPPQHWIAVTPPRIPRLRTLQDVVGSTDPVLLDWLVGLAFPCQRPFGHQNGVDEVPEVADPARPVRRGGQLAGDGLPRRRAARHHRVAGPGRPPCRPI